VEAEVRRRRNSGQGQAGSDERMQAAELIQHEALIPTALAWDQRDVLGGPPVPVAGVLDRCRRRVAVDPKRVQPTVSVEDESRLWRARAWLSPGSTCDAPARPVRGRADRYAVVGIDAAPTVERVHAFERSRRQTQVVLADEHPQEAAIVVA